MKMIERFKNATANLHNEIEGENPARFIIDHSIDMETYKLLLLQNYMAYKKTESEISKFIAGYPGNKYLKLESDLDNLEVTLQDTPHGFSCNNIAEAFGAAYVVEGSALGGMVISRNILKCDALSGLKEQVFFSGDRENLKSWEGFKKQLSEHNFSEEEATAATEKAMETFRFFGKVFRSESPSC